jgi:hypothetical protein
LGTIWERNGIDLGTIWENPKTTKKRLSTHHGQKAPQKHETFNLTKSINYLTMKPTLSS